MADVATINPEPATTTTAIPATPMQSTGNQTTTSTSSAPEDEVPAEEREAMKRRVFIGNIALTVSQQQLEDFLKASFGDFQEVTILKQTDPHQYRRYGFVTFSTEQQAKECISKGTLMLHDRNLNFCPPVRKPKAEFLAQKQRQRQRQQALQAEMLGFPPGLLTGDAIFYPGPGGFIPVPFLYNPQAAATLTSGYPGLFVPPVSASGAVPPTARHATLPAGLTAVPQQVYPAAHVQHQGNHYQAAQHHQVPQPQYQHPHYASSSSSRHTMSQSDSTISPTIMPSPTSQDPSNGYPNPAYNRYDAGHHDAGHHQYLFPPAQQYYGYQPQHQHQHQHAHQHPHQRVRQTRQYRGFSNSSKGTMDMLTEAIEAARLE